MSLKDELKLRGFEEQETRGKCRYYVKDGEKYAVAFPVRLEDEYALVVENAMFEKLGYPSIFLDDKTGKGMLVPCIQRGCRYARIHNLIYPVQVKMSVDHINHNRFFCVQNNLRYCTSKENNMNRQDECEVSEPHGCGRWKYTYEFSVDINDNQKIALLKSRNFKEVKRTEKKVTFRSNAFYDSKVKCFQKYRNLLRRLYKGTNMEKFVYDIENDFSETLYLLISHYVFGEITEEQMYEMNLRYWRKELG